MMNGRIEQNNGNGNDGGGGGGLNIILPMGGIGSRFTKEQYRFPKPLVRICGREMIFWLLDNLNISHSMDIIWMAMPSELDEQFLITNRLRKEYPKLDIRTVHLEFQTKGAAETLYAVLQDMTQDELSKRTISLDCATIYFSDILVKLRNLTPGHGASYYFEDHSGRPVFSYIKLDEESQRIEDIREKVIISTHANTGAYGFASGALMREYCGRRLDEDIGVLGEYYTSSVIKDMIDDGYAFKGIHVEDFVNVGTPKQLQDFIASIRSKEPNDNTIRTKSVEDIQKKKQRFCFDLDGTLVSFPEVAKDYTTVRPIQSNIKLAQELHAAGHTIIIQTARRMKTHGGNVAAVIADIGKLTIETLEKFQIPYDELIFGKPWADVYIDDNAIHAQMNTFKEIGWLRGEPDEHEGYWERKTSIINASFDSEEAYIEPRSFNTIMKVGSTVIKAGPKKLMLGERYFYQNVPEGLSDYFPKLLPNEGDENDEKFYHNEYGDEMLQIRMESISGVPVSTLLLGKCMTRGRLLAFLNVLRDLHFYEGPTGEEKLDSSILYQNYSSKVKQRYEEYESVYNNLGSDAFRDYQVIMEYLEEYETNNRAQYAKVIHGDPVFTNILLTNSSTIKLLDMRGHAGDTLTLQGDALYDLGKVYQSLTGYDFLLQNDVISERDFASLEEMKECFWTFVSDQYPNVSHDDVKMITTSLYFSLIPLHSPQKRGIFFEQCHKLLELELKQ